MAKRPESPPNQEPDELLGLMKEVAELPTTAETPGVVLDTGLDEWIGMARKLVAREERNKRWIRELEQPDPERYTTYRNTEANAQRIGWASFPEYCVGCPESSYITHDTRLGLFFYHNSPDMFAGASIVHDEKLPR